MDMGVGGRVFVILCFESGCVMVFIRVWKVCVELCGGFLNLFLRVVVFISFFFVLL